jgi:hypothetical protein
VVSNDQGQISAFRATPVAKAAEPPKAPGSQSEPSKKK